MRFKNVNERYDYTYRKQRKLLEEFSEEKKLYARNLMYLYQCNKEDLSDDVYRACAFFINGEYNAKPGALWLLYQAAERLLKDSAEVPNERGLDRLCYEFRVYSRMLAEGGYDGRVE
jgi:hypothetical protein